MKRYWFHVWFWHPHLILLTSGPVKRLQIWSAVIVERTLNAVLPELNASGAQWNGIVLMRSWHPQLILLTSAAESLEERNWDEHPTQQDVYEVVLEASWETLIQINEHVVELKNVETPFVNISNWISRNLLDAPTLYRTCCLSKLITTPGPLVL